MDFSKNILSKALFSLFEKMNQKELSDNEKNQIEQIANGITSAEERAPNDYIDDLDDETKEILLEEEIDHAAQAIRIITVGIVDAINGNNSFYEVKRNLPLIRESHSIVLKYCHTDLFSQIINYAKIDMFEGDMPILDDQNQYLSFFYEYINNPDGFSILTLKERASPDLIQYLEQAQAFEV